MRAPSVPTLLVLTVSVLGPACGAAGEPEKPPAGGTSGGTGATASGTGSTGAAPSGAGAGTLTDAGVIEPPSTLSDPVEFATSCEQERCAADEKCLDCTFGTCCGKNCGQQLPCPAGEVNYCDRQGGAIACSAP